MSFALVAASLTLVLIALVGIVAGIFQSQPETPSWAHLVLGMGIPLLVLGLALDRVQQRK